MKNIKSILAGLAVVSSMSLALTSCDDVLDLSPIDYYGSGNFWTTEAQVEGYVYTLDYYLRARCFNHTIMFGELRGGLYQTSSGSTDGSTHLNAGVILQNLDSDNTGVSTFGSYYGAITQTNLFIIRVGEADYLTDAKKNYYLAIGHGIRAFLYFDLYRTYGAVPLRLDVAVIDGETDPNKLYMGRNTPDEVMTQIKEDLSLSLSYFGDVSDFDPYGLGNKVVWSKCATEYLAGEVYLWNAKVSVSDNNSTHAAEPGDISTAKTYFQHVVSNYGLSLLSDFSQVFDQANKANDEVIFAIRYKEDEATHAFADDYVYLAKGYGTLTQNIHADGSDWDDPMDLRGVSGSAQWYEYENSLFESYDAEDQRRDATFVPCYSRADYEADGTLTLLSAPVKKNIGYTNSSGVHIWNGDQIYFRLAGAYLALAEIANYEGDNTAVETYMNIIRQRAYGENYDVNTYGYTSSTFAENEIAILNEKDKEFVQEGQRWYDVCRMTAVKGGAVTDHLAFSTDPRVFRNGCNLSTSEAYKLLWPLDATILGNDPLLEQTVGY